MNFVVSTTTLLKHLKSINGVLNSSNTIPILDNFLFEVTPNQLIVSASDMETTVTTQLTVEAKESGSIAIPARTLVDTLSNFPEQPLTFLIDKKTYGIKISTDNGEYKLTGHNPEEYPRTPKLEGSASIDMKTDVLATAITKTLFATSNDDLRPVMCGVFCQFTETDSVFVATDAHKLVRYRRSDAKATHSAAFIMPKKPLTLLKNLLAGVDDVVSIEYNKTNATFIFGNTTLVCRLIDGKYPNYDAVIPKQNPNKLTVDRSAFAGALKRVSVFSNKATHQVRLKITGSQLSLSAEDLDFANEANERLTCTYVGEDIEIGFNSKFLLDMINNMEGDEIQIEMSAPNRAGIITATKKDNPAEDILMLVMPVMLNN
ncbi:MAG TPA: DNA polymerase III subunit beta [Bacteroidia bacterium]|jgi:DNA polymerase III subunit beta|nr:DNA polymerase III subunit beta [Bacteroidia bacterium]